MKARMKLKLNKNLDNPKRAGPSPARWTHPMSPPARGRVGSIFILLISFFILPLCSGCAVLAMAAHGAGQKVAATYSGLAGQSVGVMVWAERGVRADWPAIQLDLANLVQDKLRKSTAPEVKGVTWPVKSASIVRYQDDHPGIEAVPVTDVAPSLGVSRLIYIELENFSTRSDTSYQMFRGNVTATLKVIETQNNKSSIGYQESDIHSFFPPKSAPEGVLDSNDLTIYRGTLDELSDEIVNRLTTHEVYEEMAGDK
jgi:hypothetical protein